MVVFSHTQSPVHLHSFAYECPANCFEVTIKRTIEERKGTPGSNWHLGVCIKKSFYIFELKIDKGTETGRHKIHYWRKVAHHDRVHYHAPEYVFHSSSQEMYNILDGSGGFSFFCVFQEKVAFSHSRCASTQEFKFRKNGVFCQFGINFKVD